MTAAATCAPTIEVEETDFGLRIYSVRRPAPERTYVRISNFVMPNLALFGPAETRAGDGYSDRTGTCRSTTPTTGSTW